MMRARLSLIRNRFEGIAYRTALGLLGCATDGMPDRGSAGSGPAAVTLCRRREMMRRGLAPIREAWWDQTRLEPYLNTWRYVLLLEAVEQWNLRRARVPETGESADGILVVQLEHLGNLIHTIPLIMTLQERFSGMSIHLLVGPWCAEVARRIPGVEDVIVYAPRILQLNRGDEHHCLSWSDELEFLRSLRARRYRLLVSCGPGNLVDRLIIQAVRPARWVGVRTEGDIYPEWCAASPVSYDSRMWEAERLLSLVDPPERCEAESVSLSFPLDEDGRRFGTEAAARARKAMGAKAPVVVMAPGAGWPGRLWPTEHYAEVAHELAQEGTAVILVGGRDAIRAAGWIERHVPVSLNLAGQTTLMQAAGVIAAGDVFVGSDSGLLHVAAAIGIPTVGLFGPLPPWRWAPRGEWHVALYHPVRCHGCVSWHPRSRCRDDRACMRAISSAEVLAGIRELLAARRRCGAPGADH